MSKIIVGTDDSDDVASVNPDAPSVTYATNLEFVNEVVITISATKSKQLPTKPVELSILACISKSTVFTKGVFESSECYSMRKAAFYQIRPLLSVL